MSPVKMLLSLLPLFISSSLAAAVPENAARGSCSYYCGSTCYWDSDVSAALAKGYELYQDGETAGDYPHQYHDYEGFAFSVSGTYYEYPILKDYDVYTGGSPGADRVIFNENDELAGLITHTGASSEDGFVQCTSA